MLIQDGTGSGSRVKVANNRLFTESIIIQASAQAARTASSFNVNTGDITLTTATESAVLYLKNNEDRDLIIKSLVYLLGNSTGGTGDIVIRIIRNPTTGTIISGATDVDILSNRNFGSSKLLLADVYKGAEGLTFTNGEDAFYSRLAGDARFYLIETGDVLVPKGSSVGIDVTPQTGNTSMIAQIALSVYLEDE